ncbi:hypothetical protein A3762_03005 [Oleiphilus sp. HI0125]|nr:CbiX/SirB N-terminal domain-containing protein [Oleiphilus sp. HI0125]KZZ60632.1 hypothetical protein A3762_03005 [Oleiphilus sp. HI0125]
MKTKIILLAHGSSNTSWSDAFFDMTKTLREQFDQADLAFMELSEPSLQDVCAHAASEGYEQIQVLPLFFATGRHLKKDVPNMIKEIKKDLSVDIKLLPAIGELPEFRDALMTIVQSKL